MKFRKNIPVYLLGLIFVVFSLQFFYVVFAHVALPPMNDMANQFMTVLFTSGFVWILKVLELLIGIMFFIPRTRNLALILIAPIIVNIVLFEALVIKDGFGAAIPGLVALVCAVIGIYQRRAVYMPIVAKPEISA